MVYELGKMCSSTDFDRKRAEQIMQQIDLNQEFVPIEDGWKWQTILLEWAIEKNNIAMVALLLKNGADPNLLFDVHKDESCLWNLQYNDGETAEENENRLQIVQLLLEYGANPHINPEPEFGRNLFDHVVFDVFNDDGGTDSWIYLSRFLILLIAYGATSDYCTPRIVKDFDKANMRQYRFFLVPAGNNQYSGVIQDDAGNVAAYV